MGCFNTKGFFSRVDLEVTEDKAFVLICAQYNKPFELKEGESLEEYDYTGKLIPLTFPILGNYNTYGQLCDIVHDYNTSRLEEVIGDTVENFLDVLYNVTVFPHYLTKETIEKYRSYKKILLGQEKTVEDLIKEYHDRNLKEVISIDRWLETMNKLSEDSNQELIWIMDHAWVYDTLGETYYQDIYKNFDQFKDQIYGSLYSTWTKFDKIWKKEENTLQKDHKEDVCKYLSFSRYLYLNDISLKNSYCTGQDVDWDKISQYTSKLDKFVDTKMTEMWATGSKPYLNYNLKNPKVNIYDPQGYLIGRTDSDIQFTDFLLQIKKSGLKGYTVSVVGKEDEKKEILPNGTILNPPNELFPLLTKQLEKLCGKD